MANTIWQSSGSGDFAVSANWTNGVPGSVASLIGVLNGTSHVSLASNLDQSGAANAFRIRSTPEYFGDIGGPGNPLIVKGDSTDGNFDIQIRSPGNTYIEMSAGINSSVFVDTETGFVEITGEDNTGTLDDSIFASGRIVIGPTCKMGSTFQVLGVSTNVTVEDGLDASYGAPTGVWISGGETLWKRELDSSNVPLQVIGGSIEITGDLSPTYGVTQSGGLIIYDPAATASTIAALHLLGGKFDVSRYARELFTFDLFVYPGVSYEGEISITSGLLADLNKPYP